VRRYRCVDAQKAAGFAVAAACQAAGVTRSAYYAWAATTAQGPAERQREEAELVSEIGRIHARSRGTYGAPRIHAELRRRGWTVNHKRVERLMRATASSATGPAGAAASPSKTPPPRPPRICWGGCSTLTGSMWPGAAM
jgi:putative transposase